MYWGGQNLPGPSHWDDWLGEMKFNLSAWECRNGVEVSGGGRDEITNALSKRHVR
jgi:hypothetical protein